MWEKMDKQLKTLIATTGLLGTVVGTTFAFTTVFVTKTYFQETMEAHEKQEDLKLQLLAATISKTVAEEWAKSLDEHIKSERRERRAHP